MKLTIPVACLTISLTVLASCTAPERASEDNTAAAEPTPDEIKQMQQEAGKIIEQQIGNLQKKEAATFPCSLFPQQEIEALAGNSLDPGSYTFNHVSEDGHDYRSESCDWSAKGGEGNEVGLWVSLPRHFSSGNVECSVGSANQKTSGIGDQAWWQFQKYFGMGTLRVCSANAMLEVKVKLTSKDEVAARKVAQTMAEKVLASS